MRGLGPVAAFADRREERDLVTERSNTQPTERLRRYWDKQSSSYDREMAFLERVLFEDRRAWVCSQTSGDILEVAIGTGRNLPSIQRRSVSPAWSSVQLCWTSRVSAR